MQVPDDVRKCICFVAYQSHGEARLAGTAFFLGGPLPDGVQGAWGGTVTAAHVIEQIQAESDDGKVTLVLNDRGTGRRSASFNIEDWLIHPDDPIVDVAVLPWLPGLDQFDQLVYTADQAVNDELIYEESISTGDEVFLVGLFSRHSGSERNIPIVRVGNIAAMPADKVETSRGLMQAYLVEARSIGGLSGSPVFVSLGVARTTPSRPPLTLGRAATYLLGVMHGHWDVMPHVLDGEAVNMGIGIVTPISKVLEIMQSGMHEDAS